MIIFILIFDLISFAFISVTSSSVWVNLPAAASLLIVFRYLSLDYEMRRKAAAYNNKSGSTSIQSSKKPIENTKAVAKFEWRAKVNSPVVEDAIDHFTRHLISEWVTDLWYSRLTPDKEGPEELVQIINGVLGEISGRMRNINLIDFLIRFLVSLFVHDFSLSLIVVCLIAELTLFGSGILLISFALTWSCFVLLSQRLKNNTQIH
jgi:sorting nexin-13